MCESLGANIYLGRTQGALFGDHLVTTQTRERTGDPTITSLTHKKDISTDKTF